MSIASHRRQSEHAGVNAEKDAASNFASRAATETTPVAMVRRGIVDGEFR
jgi:hypothetical protein